MDVHFKSGEKALMRFDIANRRVILLRLPFTQQLKLHDEHSLRY